MIQEAAKVEMLPADSIPCIWLRAFYKKDGQLVVVKPGEKVADLVKYCGTDYSNPLLIGLGMYIFIHALLSQASDPLIEHWASSTCIIPNIDSQC